MLKIIADNKIPFLKGVIEPFVKIEYYAGNEINSKIIADADALIVRTRTKCNKNLLESSSVKFISTATIGFDHIDTEYCAANNICWKNAPGCNSGSVLQYFASVLLTLAKKNNFSLNKKTIGIIGVGNVGKKIEKFARLLGMKVLLHDPPRARCENLNNFIDLETIFNKADIITLHVPLSYSGTDKTYHLIGKHNLNRLKSDCWIINSSRGEVIDNIALNECLAAKQIAGAVLDVWEKEPAIDHKLLNHVFLATPHIAGYSIDGKANGTAMSVQALCNFFDLPLTNWYPSNIPMPENYLIGFDCKNLNFQEILSRIIIQTYNVSADDIRFRQSPEKFEFQRENYPFRREFSAYHLNLLNISPEIQNKLLQLGFNLITTCNG